VYRFANFLVISLVSTSTKLIGIINTCPGAST
jgi:hypothetical protein